LTWIKEVIGAMGDVGRVKTFRHRLKQRFVAATGLAATCLVVIHSSFAQNLSLSNMAIHAPAAAAVSAVSTNAAAEPADASAMKFVQTCAGCHTFGGGKLTGPDLVVAAAWPKADLKANIKRMEEKAGPLGEEVMEQLAVFLKDSKVRERIKAAESAIALKYAAKLEPGSILVGREYFTGVRPFKNRGTACAGCHGVLGEMGMLGPDLRGVHAKMGETALISAIAKANFKIMDAAFRNHPVTPQEALHLAKYLGSLPPGAPPQQAGFPVLAAGAALAAVSLSAITFLYRRRANSLPLQRRRK
jgi:cytochrome c553